MVGWVESSGLVRSRGVQGNSEETAGETKGPASEFRIYFKDTGDSVGRLEAKEWQNLGKFILAW